MFRMTDYEISRRNAIADAMDAQNYHDYATIIELFPLNLTKSPDCVAFIQQQKGDTTRFTVQADYSTIEIGFNDRIVINYFLKTSDAVTIIKHEILHKVLQHCARDERMRIEAKAKNDEKLQWLLDHHHRDTNIAADCDLSRYYDEVDKEVVRNLTINGQPFPGFIIEEYKEHPNWVNMTYEEMLRDLAEQIDIEKEKMKPPQGPQGPQGPDDPDDDDDNPNPGPEGPGGGNGGKGKKSKGKSDGGKYDDLDDLPDDPSDDGSTGGDPNGEDGGKGKPKSNSKNNSKGSNSSETDSNGSTGGDGDDSEDVASDDEDAHIVQIGDAPDADFLEKEDAERAKQIAQEVADGILTADDDETEEDIQAKVDKLNKIFSDPQELLKRIKQAVDKHKEWDDRKRAEADALAYANDPVTKLELSITTYINELRKLEYAKDPTFPTKQGYAAGLLIPRHTYKNIYAKPYFSVYFDRSGSWKPLEKNHEGRRIISLLNKKRSEGLLDFELLEFDTKILAPGEDKWGGTSGEPIIHDILSTNPRPNNVIVITDGDISAITDHSSVTVNGAVWMLFVDYNFSNPNRPESVALFNAIQSKDPKWHNFYNIQVAYQGERNFDEEGVPEGGFGADEKEEKDLWDEEQKARANNRRERVKNDGGADEDVVYGRR